MDAKNTTLLNHLSSIVVQHAIYGCNDILFSSKGNPDLNFTSVICYFVQVQIRKWRLSIENNFIYLSTPQRLFTRSDSLPFKLLRYGECKVLRLKGREWIRR